MNTLKEDFNATLPKVQRKWLRRSATVISTLVLIPMCLIHGLVTATIYTWEETASFIRECW